MLMHEKPWVIPILFKRRVRWVTTSSRCRFSVIVATLGDFVNVYWDCTFFFPFDLSCLHGLIRCVCMCVCVCARSLFILRSVPRYYLKSHDYATGFLCCFIHLKKNFIYLIDVQLVFQFTREITSCDFLFTSLHTNPFLK